MRPGGARTPPGHVQDGKKYLRKSYSLFVSFGLDPLKVISSFRGYPKYFENLGKLKKSISRSELHPVPDSVKRFGTPYPIVNEFFSSAGTASGHYFHQEAGAAAD